MAFEAIHLILLFGYLMVLAGFLFKEYIFMMMGSILLYPVSIYIIVNGLGNFNNVTTDAFGIISLAFAFYVSIAASLEYANS